MKTKAKIMIVDDAEMNREILMVILGDEYEYVQAENGRQAIHILQQELFENSEDPAHQVEKITRGALETRAKSLPASCHPLIFRIVRFPRENQMQHPPDSDLFSL